MQILMNKMSKVQMLKVAKQANLFFQSVEAEEKK